MASLLFLHFIYLSHEGPQEIVSQADVQLSLSHLLCSWRLSSAEWNPAEAGPSVVQTWTDLFITTPHSFARMVETVYGGRVANSSWHGTRRWFHREVWPGDIG